MKALVFTGPKALEVRSVANPVADEDDVLIRIDSVGICGSDMHAWAGHDERRPAPLILGHEVAGTIAIGPDAGKRVTVNPLVTCGSCAQCRAGCSNLCPSRQIISMPPREGGFAEYLSMPRKNLVDVTEGVSLEQAALAEPIACGWHAVRLAQRAMRPKLSDSTCLVLGGGAIGLGAGLVLALHGAREIWIGEINPARRRMLATQGDFRVFDPLATDGPPTGDADLVVDGVGSEATRAHASRSVRPGGVIAHIGLGSASSGLDVRRFTLQEITFFGTYTYTYEDFCDTAQAIFDRRLGALDWCEVRPLSDGARAFEEISASKLASPKIILKP